MEKLLEQTISESYSQFLIDVEGAAKVEEKIRCSLDFMKKALSSDQPLIFRDFWEVKRLCLGLFKEKLNSRSRNVFWAEYIELSEEVRRVKEILDEQSSFAQEQIDLAVQAIKEDLENFAATEISEIQLPVEAKTLLKNGSQYTRLQKELSLLNAFAGRLTALRKELIQTQMRVRHKNRLFEQLSALGDKVFPRRKEGVKALSELFLSDVEGFVETNSKLEKGPFFDLKDEIKALQKFAKILTLNTRAFSLSREMLSGFWDRIKDKEAVYRCHRAEEREKAKENLKQLSPKIDTLTEECTEGKITLKEAEEKISAIFVEMKELELPREDVKELRKQISDAKRPLEEKEQAERQRRKKEEELQSKRQKEMQVALFDQLQEVLNQAEGLPFDTLVQKWETLVKEGKALSVSGIEKAMLENRLDSIADHIQEKKWQSLLQENPEELTSSLQTLLSERHKEKRKIKEALEEHRKVAGGSSLNFEQSMLCQELIVDKKMRLDAIETMLEEIEEKLFDLEE